MALVVAREFAPAWIMRADADDLISRCLVKEYELGLRDGVDCAVVRNGLWQEVLQRAAQLDLHTTARMRSSVLDLARSHLCPATATRDWLRRMGVTQ